MPQFNEPTWNQNENVGTTDDKPIFPETYLRSSFNDLGILPAELTGLRNIFEFFTLAEGDLGVQLSVVPAQFSIPQIYMNGILLKPTVDYSLVSRTVTIPSGYAGAQIKAYYTSEVV